MDIDPCSDLQDIRPDLVLDAARIGVWRWDPATRSVTCNGQMRSLCGLPAGRVTLDAWLERLRPEDRTPAMSCLERAIHESDSQSIECRMLTPENSAERWIAIQGRAYWCAGSAQVVGTACDITARKKNEVQSELAISDLKHRMSNVFAVMTSIISMSKEGSATVEHFAAAMQARIGALARAHNLVLEADASGAVSLRQLLKAELGPFHDLGVVHLYGAPVALSKDQVVPMNCIAHELTTNAVKHGALSCPQGELSISWTVDRSGQRDQLVLRWKERCPGYIAAPQRVGLGSRILKRSADTNLRGNISLEFEPDGLLATLVAPLAQRSPV